MNNSPKRINFVIYAIILAVAILLVSGLFGGKNLPQVSYSDMRALFLEKKVRSFEWEEGVLTLELYGDPQKEPTMVIHKLADVEMFRDDLSDTYESQQNEGIIEGYNFVPLKGTPWYLAILPYLIPLALLLVFMYFLMGRSNGGAAGGIKFGKANVRVGSGEKKVTFADVAGVDEEKQELEEIVDFLRNPKKYQQIGAKIPKGVLLVGPPGTGKTLIARAVAGEADVQFLSISGSDFVELYVGVGASRVRDLFEQAKKGAPSIVFIDEIDAVGRRRGAGLGGGNDEREQTLNQLLVEMDGFGSNEGVIVMAATNRQDILDPALLRPGRFDRQIYINPPDVTAREAILRVHAKEKMLADDVDLKVIAHATGGFTGADLANLLNEAALYSAKENRPVITMHALEESILKVIAGPEKRSHVRLERDRRITAYHEAGHAVAMHFLPTQDPVHSITIIPRGKALGMTISLPEEDTDHLTRNEMRETIVGLLGGRVAEKLVFDDVSTGASNDIQRASRLARDMIVRYGMSERLGTVSYDDGDEIFVGRDYERTKAYSEHTGGEIDAEMKREIDEAYRKCETILTEHRDRLDAIAAFLLEHETMSRRQFEACMDGAAIPEEAEGFFDSVEQASEETAETDG